MQILESTHTIPDDVRKATLFISDFFTSNGYHNWEYLDLASRNLVKDAHRPNLGLATTRQLLEELEVRAIVGGYAEYRPEVRELKKLLFHVLHQRTGPLGEKVEDILQRENQELLLACIKHTHEIFEPSGTG